MKGIYANQNLLLHVAKRKFGVINGILTRVHELVGIFKLALYAEVGVRSSASILAIRLTRNWFDSQLW
jgi:hypothetical protein